MQTHLFKKQLSHQKAIASQAAKIPGLQIFFDFITPAFEKQLLTTIDQAPWLADLNRRVQHYGYKYDYRGRKIDPSLYLGPLPGWLNDVAGKIREQNIINFMPDQAIVNEYKPGQGIASHIDCEPCFGDTIITLSLGSDCVMEFKRAGDASEKVPVLLPRRSLAVLSGESRYNWYHGIPKRKKDIFNHEVFIRQRRVSITFRKVLLTE